MHDYEADLNGNLLVKEEELYFVYEGPSFNGKMEMPSLINQLKSTEFLIKEIIKNLYAENKLKEPENIRIYLKLKRGSFEEIIQIIFNHPLTISIVGGCVVLLFGRLVNKKENSQCQFNIQNMTTNLTIVKEVDNIVSPLQKEGDKLIVYSPSKQEVKTEIGFKEKDILKEVIRKLQEEVVVEIYEEEFFGYLYFINIDKGTFGFTFEETNKHIPAIFIEKPNIEEIRKMLGEKLKIKANATYRNKELSKLEIKEYQIKERKSLQDYSTENKIG